MGRHSSGESRSRLGDAADSEVAGTAADLRLIVRTRRLWWQIALILVIIVAAYIGVLLALGRLHNWLVLLVIPAGLAGISVGALLDRAQRPPGESAKDAEVAAQVEAGVEAGPATEPAISASTATEALPDPASTADRPTEPVDANEAVLPVSDPASESTRGWRLGRRTKSQSAPEPALEPTLEVVPELVEPEPVVEPAPEPEPVAKAEVLPAAASAWEAARDWRLRRKTTSEPDSEPDPVLEAETKAPEVETPAQPEAADESVASVAPTADAVPEPLPQDASSSARVWRLRRKAKNEPTA